MQNKNVEITKVKKYNAGFNYVISYGGIPVAIAKSINRATLISGYLINGTGATEIKDGGLLRALNKALSK